MDLLARTRPDIPSASPEGFIEARFMKELDATGYFDEMNRKYSK